MKQLRITASILGILALALFVWSILQLVRDDSDKIQAVLNMIYFISLFVAFFSFRISLGHSQQTPVLIVVISLLIVSISTYTWFSPVNLLQTGKITLGLIPLLIGLTLGLIVKGDSKLSKALWIAINFSTGMLALFVFIGVHEPSLYTIAFFAMIIATLAVSAHFMFGKTS